jgi:hypothetical protein
MKFIGDLTLFIKTNKFTLRKTLEKNVKLFLEFRKNINYKHYGGHSLLETEMFDIATTYKLVLSQLRKLIVRLDKKFPTKNNTLLHYIHNILNDPIINLFFSPSSGANICCNTLCKMKNLHTFLITNIHVWKKFKMYNILNRICTISYIITYAIYDTFIFSSSYMILNGGEALRKVVI